MYFSQALAAGVAVDISDPADFLRVLSFAQADLSIEFYKGGRKTAETSNVGSGYAEKVLVPFDRVRVSSALGGALKLVTRLGAEVRYDSVTISNLSAANGGFAQSVKTVTNASASMIAANAARRYLLIQNNDLAGVLSLRFDGAAATMINGILLQPGQHYELQGYAPTGAVFAIGSIASNANVIVVEG